ncbi:antibiotic biosynthesis monooxygenase [Williamsia phyllosphaerae]|uniref:Antibiotic biosynthesis monooxygenase n=2 Tax=Williamsia phyllosphaerae TaxID=885042 RepID=A0ABQ1UNF4_9NOCA|nr:antibiotic biosynthesis monooxygenase [Williamsia phyllosphaerae]
MMADLHVVATIPAKPGFEKEVGDALKGLAAATQDEAGCISYELFESASTPGVFVTVELWESQEHLDAHMKAPALTEAMSAVGEHLGDLAIHPLKPF